MNKTIRVTLVSIRESAERPLILTFMQDLAKDLLQLEDSTAAS